LQKSPDFKAADSTISALSALLDMQSGTGLLQMRF
jgi:hypothetical protein